MATLITVFSCDDCGKIVGLKTDADWRRFDTQWADSVRHQFCLVCKEKRANLALMEMDARFLENIVGGSKKDRTDYVN